MKLIKKKKKINFRKKNNAQNNGDNKGEKK